MKPAGIGLPQKTANDKKESKISIKTIFHCARISKNDLYLPHLEKNLLNQTFLKSGSAISKRPQGASQCSRIGD